MFTETGICREHDEEKNWGVYIAVDGNSHVMSITEAISLKEKIDKCICEANQLSNFCIGYLDGNVPALKN